MKTDWSALEPFRQTNPELGPYRTKVGETFGVFVLRTDKAFLKCIATDGHDGTEDTGWEHVSVSCMYSDSRGMIHQRIPHWLEMNAVKNAFWNEDECVIQFHPPKSDYINENQFVLHLWKWKQGEFPMPPKDCV